MGYLGSMVTLSLVGLSLFLSFFAEERGFIVLFKE